MTSSQLANNVARGAIQAAALYMAGVRAIEISTFDEAIRTPSQAAHTVALGTQHILQMETGIADVADPLGGSWYVEALTDEIEQRILRRIEAIESRGDVLELAGAGFFRSIFEDAMVDRASEIAEGRRPVVGANVNTLPPDQDTLLREVSEQRIEPDYVRIEEIRQWRAARDATGVVSTLDELEVVCRSGANIMPALLNALRAQASMGECVGVLRECHGLPYDPLRCCGRPR